MTIRPRLPLFTLLLLLPLVGGWAVVTCAAPEDPALEKLKPPVVAIVGGRKLTFDGFCKAVAQQALTDVKRSRAGPRGILEQLIEERMVQLECKRLGIVVTGEDVKNLWKDWDTRLRVNSNGERTLQEVIKDQGTTQNEFLEQMWHILRKERVALHPEYLGPRLPKNETARLTQIGIVIKKLREKTDVKYGITTIDHVQQGAKHDALEKGIVATIDGESVTEMEFGRALVMRLSADKVREYLDTECKTGIMSMQGVTISDEEFDEEVQRLRDLWPLQRELQREEIWSTVSFKDRFEADFRGGFEDVKQSRHGRGLIGLVRRMRSQVTEEEVRAEFESQKDTRFGEHILVTDIQITFAQQGGLLAGGRSREAALRLARDLVQRQESGQPFDKICAAVNAKKDRSMQAKRLRLYKSNRSERDAGGKKVKGRTLSRDAVLYESASRLRDGDITSPFDTLSEVHVLRREGLRPARTLDDVRPHIVEVLARRKARDWIDKRIKDPASVRIRWPLSERG